MINDVTQNDTSQDDTFPNDISQNVNLKMIQLNNMVLQVKMIHMIVNMKIGIITIYNNDQ